MIFPAGGAQSYPIRLPRCCPLCGDGWGGGSRPPDNGQHTKISASHLINQQQTANKPSPCRTAVAGAAAAAPRVTYGGHPLFFLIVTRRCDLMDRKSVVRLEEGDSLANRLVRGGGVGIK